MPSDSILYLTNFSSISQHGPGALLCADEDYEFLRRLVVEALLHDEEVPEWWPPTGG